MALGAYSIRFTISVAVRSRVVPVVAFSKQCAYVRSLQESSQYVW
jgi:hypothetical protein